MEETNYPYLVGCYETMTYFLAGELVKQGLIKHEQYKTVHEYIQQRVEGIKTRARKADEEEARILAEEKLKELN